MSTSVAPRASSMSSAALNASRARRRPRRRSSICTRHADADSTDITGQRRRVIGAPHRGALVASAGIVRRRSPASAIAASATRASRSGRSDRATSANAISPYRDTRPYVGLRPTTPHSAAGWRIDPPVSEPSASGVMPAATATADPPLDPPGNSIQRPRDSATGRTLNSRSTSPSQIRRSWFCR